jgi:hypothetical protein
MTSFRRVTEKEKGTMEQESACRQIINCYYQNSVDLVIFLPTLGNLTKNQRPCILRTEGKYCGNSCKAQSECVGKENKPAPPYGGVPGYGQLTLALLTCKATQLLTFCQLTPGAFSLGAFDSYSRNASARATRSSSSSQGFVRNLKIAP